MNQPINIIFDGPPAPESGRFVEVETDDGKSIKAGEWHDRGDGTWALRITELPPESTDARPFRAPANGQFTGAFLFINADDWELEMDSYLHFYFGPEEVGGYLSDQHLDWLQEQMEAVFGDYLNNEAESMWSLDMKGLLMDPDFDITWDVEDGCQPNENGEVWGAVYEKFFKPHGVTWRSNEDG